ncbi:hypothetical protein DEO72_LG10g2070 [Vigna unguiculata]|uniref:Uncharacterized protein n=1 Tax=Vigna unguiculata TaxID=3917 RepID=A0A4D6NBY7_VIGUN|nr:hypothetical protein DEO72_LG10g2070 [Vigna unguiculata]
MMEAGCVNGVRRSCGGCHSCAVVCGAGAAEVGGGQRGCAGLHWRCATRNGEEDGGARCRSAMEGCSGCCCRWFCSCVFRREGGDGTVAAGVVRELWWWRDGTRWRWCNCGGRRDWRRRLPWRVEGKLGLGFHV